MEKLTNLFRLIELTRSQPQSGYALAGIPKASLSDLAQHHFMVTFFAWQLAIHFNRAGAKLNVQKVLELALIHDLGELFGGDISMPYAKANPKARKFAKAFESENQLYLAKYFGKGEKSYRDLAQEIADVGSDEAIIAKCADYLEVAYYKSYAGRLTRGDMQLSVSKINQATQKLKDRVARAELNRFMDSWSKDLTISGSNEFFEDSKGR